ncbi:MAG: TlpA disulfide reductase family protein [Pseudomonadota bacterium]
MKCFTKVFTQIIISLTLILAFGLNIFAIDNDISQLFKKLNINEEATDKDASDFELPDLTNKTHKLSSYFGNVIILTFWATWCGYCRRELNSYKALHSKYESKDLKIIAVSVDSGGAIQVAPLAKNENYPFLMLLDPEGQNTRSYSVQAFPTTFLISKNGKILASIQGALGWESNDAYKLLDALLDEEETVKDSEKKETTVNITSELVYDEEKMAIEINFYVTNPNEDFFIGEPHLGEQTGIKSHKIQRLDEVLTKDNNLIHHILYRIDIQQAENSKISKIDNIKVRYRKDSESALEEYNIKDVMFKKGSKYIINWIVISFFILFLIIGILIFIRKHKNKISKRSCV